jgi:hypothetical protein
MDIGSTVGDTTLKRITPTVAGTYQVNEFDLNATLFTKAMLTSPTSYLKWTKAAGTGYSYCDAMWIRVEFEVTGGFRSQRWNGVAWEAASLKRWNGSAWVTTTVKRWNGTAWV